jgi:hypothetical protein
MAEIKLTWDDLLIQDADPEEISASLAPWSFLIRAQVRPIFLNRFGSWFLQRRDESVDMLDVFDGSIEQVAESAAELGRLVNTVEWQEEYLLSLAVFDLHSAGLVAAGTQCYAIPHPALGGRNPALGEEIEPRFTTVCDFEVWQSICRQALGGPR